MCHSLGLQKPAEVIFLRFTAFAFALATPYNDLMYNCGNVALNSGGVQYSEKSSLGQRMQSFFLSIHTRRLITNMFRRNVRNGTAVDRRQYIVRKSASCCFRERLGFSTCIDTRKPFPTNFGCSLFQFYAPPILDHLCCTCKCGIHQQQIMTKPEIPPTDLDRSCCRFLFFLLSFLSKRQKFILIGPVIHTQLGHLRAIQVQLLHKLHLASSQRGDGMELSWRPSWMSQDQIRS